MRRRTGSLALATAAVLVLAGCGGDADEPIASPGDSPAENTDDAGGNGSADVPEGSTMAEFAEAGTITIGTKFDQPLFGLQAPSGVPEGFDVEIGRIIATELGIDEDGIDWVETISQNRESFISNGNVDLVIATYTINDARKELVGFAGPYYEAGQSLLTMADNTDINGPDDLAGTRVCTVSGSTPETNLLENFPDSEVVPFQAYSDCLTPLRNGQVDAISTDNVILAGFAAENDDMEVRGEPFTAEPYGIGLPLDQDDFREWLNDLLEEIYEDGRWTQAWEATAGTVLPTPEPPAVDRY